VAEDSAYRHALRDIVFELIEMARTEPLSTEQRATMLRVLSMIQSQANAFELDLAEMGFDRFEADAWFLRSAD
jgi:hypothetical protein